ncbi:HMCN1-like protein, partial [Mya arenaria]
FPSGQCRCFLETSQSLECFSCARATNVTDCHVVITCSTEKSCYTSVENSGGSLLYSMGCKESSQCPSPQTIIGRDTDHVTGYDAMNKRASTNQNICNECCEANYCNRHACENANVITTTTPQQPTTLDLPEHCENNPEYNCELIGATFDICKDVAHAKTVCKRYCGLCFLVDGAWSEWSEWSQCEQTCGQSRQVRIRTCTNPPPQQGGADCIGDKHDFRTCVGQPCPVAGDWSTWSTWASCSASCGIGLTTRTRDCNKPYPTYGGDHCFGNSVEYQICQRPGCVDGGWTAWSGWGACSLTCNGGLRSRNRTCDNPPASLLGKPCKGDNREYESCGATTCQGPSGNNQKIFFAVNTPDGSMILGHYPEGNHIARRSRKVLYVAPLQEGNHIARRSRKVLYVAPLQEGNHIAHRFRKVLYVAPLKQGNHIARRSRKVLNVAPLKQGNHIARRSRKVLYVAPLKQFNHIARRSRKVLYVAPLKQGNHIARRSRKVLYVAPLKQGNHIARRSRKVLYVAPLKQGNHIARRSRKVLYVAPLKQGNHIARRFRKVLYVAPLKQGQFVAPVSGVYEFFVTFISSNSTSQCFIRRNSDIVVFALTSGDDGNWKSASASTYVHLNVSDVVDLSCGGWQYVDHNASAMFS